MNRKLLIIRHADTEAQQSGGTDHQRELTIKGRSDALRVAARIDQLGWCPKTVLCSDAARAKQTWQQMREVFDTRTEARFTDALYLADRDKALDELFTLDDETFEAGLIGHNPGWQDLVYWLSGVAVRMSPATAVLLEGIGESWSDALGQNKWELVEVIRPAQL